MMPKALLFQPRTSLLMPLEEWLPELTGRAVMLCAPEAAALYRDFAEVHPFTNYEKNGGVERKALELIRRDSFHCVVALTEYDLVRAGTVRDRLGLPGQSAGSARAFRLKPFMKELARRGGVPVAAFQGIREPCDLLDFIDAHRLPVVVKPVDGGSSNGVCILSDSEALDRFLAEGIPQGYMVEEFVAGPMCHVDGFWQDGALRFAGASRYSSDCLTHLRNESLSSVQLEDSSPLAKRLMALTRRVLESLPTPPATAFHLEVFLRNDDPEDLVFCEVASRVGGGRISVTFQKTYGVSLLRLAARSQAQLETPEVEHRNGKLHGSILLPTRPGTLRFVPERCPLPQVEEYIPMVKAGDRVEAPKGYMSCLAAFIVSGSSHDEVKEGLTAAERWFHHELRWEAPQASANGA